MDFKNKALLTSFLKTIILYRFVLLPLYFTFIFLVSLVTLIFSCNQDALFSQEIKKKSIKL